MPPSPLNFAVKSEYGTTRLRKVISWGKVQVTQAIYAHHSITLRLLFKPVLVTDLITKLYSLFGLATYSIIVEVSSLLILPKVATADKSVWMVYLLSSELGSLLHHGILTILFALCYRSQQSAKRKVWIRQIKVGKERKKGCTLEDCSSRKKHVTSQISLHSILHDFYARGWFFSWHNCIFLSRPQYVYPLSHW